MRFLTRLSLCLTLLLLGAGDGAAQSLVLPLELSQTNVLYNRLSQRGMPLSGTVGQPAGSDGRAAFPMTGDQFQGLVSFGGVMETNVARPVGFGSDQIAMRRAVVGNSLVGSAFNYQFGEVIAPPDRDEYGRELAGANSINFSPARPAMAPDQYWKREPYTNSTTAVFTGDYYWSPHAEQVYATQPGQVTVVWRKVLPIAGAVPAGLPADVVAVTVDGFTYLAKVSRYTVSAAFSKTPRRMFWTEGPFALVGKPVTIPTDRVKSITVVHNRSFPEVTELRVVGTNQVRLEYPFDGTQAGAIPITNTFWYDRTANLLRAYNMEGRVFVELLGDKRGQFGGRDIHQQLGVELVDVIRRAPTADVTVELGERLNPYPGASPAGTPPLFADPLLGLGLEFVYRHSVVGTPDFDYYSTHETQNQNDYQMHWLEQGLEGLRWPYRYVRYKMVWPSDVGRYSHYVRPASAVTEEQARATAVALPAQNAPRIAYQDALDQPRGKLTETFAYYSWLTPQHPAHRALLQFSSGEYVRFERVFSWLDEGLRDNVPPTNASPDLTRFATAFAAEPSGGTNYGAARVADGFLHLTDAVNFQEGAYLLDGFARGQSVHGFKANFKVRLSDSTGLLIGGNLLPGDGFSFHFGTLPDGTVPGAEAVDGIVDGLAVSFDAWDNGANDYAPGISVRYQGRVVAGVKLAGAGFGNPSDGILPIPLDPGTAPVIPAGTKGVLREVYSGIPGSTVADLKSHPRFPNEPSGVSVVTDFEAPVDAGDDYGQRLRALVTAPVDGLYRFAVSGDDAAELWLSPDEFPAHAVKVAGQATWSAVRDFERHPGQISDPVFLRSGRSYYVEALMKESFVGDHLTVAWQTPGGPAIVNGSPAIPGEFLTPYSEARPMTLATGPQFVPVEIELSAGGILDVSYKGVKVLQNIRTGYTPRTGRFGLSARTGAANETHWIDDLAVVVNPPPVDRRLLADFSAVPPGMQLEGNARVEAGFLHLTDAVNASSGGAWLDDFTPTGKDLVEGFKATFMVSLRDSTCCGPFPADGFSFNFGTRPNRLLDYNAEAEEGVTEGIAVSFDLWDNGPADAAPGIQVKVDGVARAAVSMGADLARNPGLRPQPTEASGLPLTLPTGARFVPVEIELRPGGLMDVSYRGVKVLADVPTGYLPRSGQFGFLARTGGANSTHWIDDLAITVRSASYVPARTFASTVATNLSSWLPGALGFMWPDPTGRPRVVDSTVEVGRRVSAPAGEAGSGLGASYLAGFIQASQGDSYHPTAYVDPFASGFDLANRGTIIPVNAIPGRNRLEVWWFRRNEVDLSRGFRNAYWPAVIGRYTTLWPSEASEIILASNAGSGPLSSLEAKGRIYVQNNPAQPGYNPNEEHALMQGGQAYALRDDLNQTTADTNYSSAPFVLLDYTASDGKTAVRPFRVRREKPEAGITFEYAKLAAQVLQPPMPLPLLGPAFAPKLPGLPRAGLNREIVGQWRVVTSSRTPAASLAGWRLVVEDPDAFRLLHSTRLWDRQGTRRWFYGTRLDGSRVDGYVAAIRPVDLPALQSLGGERYSSATDRAAEIPVGPATIYLPRAGRGVDVTVEAVEGNSVRVLAATPIPASDWNDPGAVLLPVVGNAADGAFDGGTLAWNEVPAGIDTRLQQRYASATLSDRKGNVWVYRGPHVASQPETFGMRYYYNTLPGFHFPSLGPDAQPPVGTPTPYLRAVGPDGSYLGDPVLGNADLDQADDGNALVVHYHPQWPGDAPVLQMAETLTTPKRGLPAVRGQTSLEVFYQQSQLSEGNGRLNLAPDDVSVVLHDPTREKTVAYDPAELPASIRQEMSRGRIHFPQLPPHLVGRFFLDPSRGTNGQLVLRGEFLDAGTGDPYLLLNVAGSRDAQSLRDLCPVELNDPRKSRWDAAIAALATDVERFVENPAVPGTFIPDPAFTRSIGLGDLPSVTDDDEAVDSYALTAIGPKTGYVTLLAGNGRAHTPEGEPVSLHIVRVVPELYRGELKVIESENPLNERLTFQQVVDLAGHAEDYTFEWRITAPVDGQPPATYSRQVQAVLLPPWSHVPHVLDTDSAADIHAAAQSRVAQDIGNTVSPVSGIPFSSARREGDLYWFNLGATGHRLSEGNQVVLRSVDGVELLGVIHEIPETNRAMAAVAVNPGQTVRLEASEVFRLTERVVTGRAQSMAFTTFELPPDASGPITDVWLSLSLADGLGARLLVNGAPVITIGRGAAEDTVPSDPSGFLASPRLSRYYRLPPSVLAGAAVGPSGIRTNRLAVALYSSAQPGAFLDFQVRVEAVRSADQVAESSIWIPLDPAQFVDGVRAIVGEKADVRSLSDNYLTMRYRPNGRPDAWSQWTEPQLAEGWIKRVLKGVNPFNQRVTDLFNNAVDTDVSVVAQAGRRWEGDVALNLESINDAGLIEIYETVLKRGRGLSIDAGINYGPANDALLLAAGYINDLYMMLGNEAAADAANPTIGIGTKDNTYGDVATALFSFKGQLPSMLAEELALLRGRDDFLVPGVEARPVYNRLFWNYTRGIDAGEVIYALNYNILDQNGDGRVDAADALKLFPQGHGDAYGHYLTALKGYYQLLLNPHFTWVPRSEAVLVLDRPVTVDYQDERKFAAAAGALARTGRQVFDLTWRADFLAGSGRGWDHFRTARANAKRQRSWGLDHWAVRTGAGAYVNWIAGNAMIPSNDPDPSHQGTVQQVDRTTVPELRELPAVMESLQTALDNADNGLTPLGLPEDAVPFDLNPNTVLGGEGNTHFEQVYSRARAALNNAILAFDDAKDVTRLMRSEQDSLDDLRAAVDQQELAYTNALIELFGTPYPEDIGPGRTYRTGYVGPDLFHYMYVDNAELSFNGQLDPAADQVWRIDTQGFTADWVDANGISDFNFLQPARTGVIDGSKPLESWLTNQTLYIEYNLASHGFFQKPAHWVGRRASPGSIQQAISDIAKARNAASSAFNAADTEKVNLDWAIQAFARKRQSHAHIHAFRQTLLTMDQVEEAAKLAYDIFEKFTDAKEETVDDNFEAAAEALPTDFIAGVASGGDLTSGGRSAWLQIGAATKTVIGEMQNLRFAILRGLEYGNQLQRSLIEFNGIESEEWNQELRDATSELRDKVYGMNNQFSEINARLQELDDARRRYRSMVAEGDRLQQEREIFRRRTAAVIQGYRTRDAAFRIFRHEKLERYKTLFDLASQYAYLAARAYDYETGLLGTARGRDFLQRIVNARALGVVRGGQPQFAGSDTGDPGLSSVLAEMSADWGVVKTRLGFNNPDAYGTTASLRYEQFRITTNDVKWREVLQAARRNNVLDDPDVRRSCLQLDDGSGLAVPGIVLEFSTTVANGLNLFGNPLAPWDHAFSASAFATKIHSAGVALEGYVGMSDPNANSGAVAGSGGNTPLDPNLAFLDPNALAANPYVYLIPVGVDSMRSPPLGDATTIRSWSVQDVAIPLPFNLGGSDASSVRLWQSADSLTEPPFVVRKHQAFRPISSSSLFSPDIYGGGGGLQRSQYTSTRLIGRSVWNSKWKLVIPGRSLLNDPDEGLERFIRTVKDVRLHFVTYSYSGN